MEKKIVNDSNYPLVTIGMPVYNVELYIKKSLLSLLDQCYPNIEVFVVDDHGTDHSIEIVEDLKREHPRGDCIRILRPPKNMGPGDARNRTIDEASGKYLFFLDSDDFIEPETIKKMVDQAEEHGSDIVIASGRGMNYESGEVYPIFSFPELKIISGKDAFANYVCSDLRTHIPDTIWNILFSVQYLRKFDIKFAARKDEDALFLSEYYSEVGTAVLMPDVTYNYLSRPGSIMGNQARDVIPVVEIRDRFQTDKVMTSRCSRLKNRSFYDVHCSRVVKHKFRAVCVSLRHYKKFSEKLSFNEIRQEMEHPATFAEIIKFKRYRLYNIFFYVISKLPSLMFVGIAYVMGKTMKWI